MAESPEPEAPPRRRPAAWAGLLSPAVILLCGSLLAVAVVEDGPTAAYSGLLRTDALTAWMLLVIGAVALVACASTPAYLAGEWTTGRPAAQYHALVHAFLAAMSLAVLTANLGVLWVAIEATTIVTAFLVGHRHTRTSVEAAWKYVVICSAGIALAFLGTVLIYYAARQAGIAEAWALDWPTLLARADRLDPAVTRLGITLVILGFGAKAGLIPLHAWLPDAHSQAPAPVSALMSGVLLSVAFAAILRYRIIADAALGPGFTQVLLAGIALLTLALAAGMLLAQRDYKRMLAYSSMEHMSLIALAAAIGSPLALSAALLHIAGHGLAKSVAFCASGHILRLTGTTRIGRVRGLLARVPWLGALFGLGVVALLGFPPFSLFASELGIARAGFAAGGGLAWATAAAFTVVLVAFAALSLRTARMLLGPGEPVDEHPSALWPLALGLLGCAALGIGLGPLTDLLTIAADTIGRP
ncbi:MULTISPECIES: proton-conducting transporter membrane subunit [unclassified Streptomyces]|uniref:proton-conducting transporter transmembrane domain-containing protein n=1 Tax=unclassified Streptomyces TaxID=2593676 RepID=UPI0023653328|nr:MULTISPECIES: proton-conducting transporter membrane subunit [unclassified Streptomyces]MDF3143492.1 proton-conducting transporter membrane subunit [Streptomyces sp. T21Q-yed]WDF44037.1 proton-conducting transporter membrane subunit [Streptomyces sp. T12]